MQHKMKQLAGAALVAAMSLAGTANAQSTEDVKIGGFYLDQHDYKGAYARYKEATLVNPENADAVFGLAEAARGLNRKDEAADNYRIYLDAFPDGKKAKEARKALAALTETSKK